MAHTTGTLNLETAVTPWLPCHSITTLYYSCLFSVSSPIGFELDESGDKYLVSPVYLPCLATFSEGLLNE